MPTPPFFAAPVNVSSETERQNQRPTLATLYLNQGCYAQAEAPLFEVLET